MKKIILTLIMLFSLCNITFAQSNFGWDKSCGFGIGYSNIYTTSSFAYADEPRDLLNIDMKVYGLYIGMAGGWSTHRWDSYNDPYTLNTYTLKAGPSFALWTGYASRVTFTPFIGGLWHNQEYGDYGWDRDTYCYESKFVYGGRVSYDYKNFEIGAHMSNYEIGVTLGYNVAFE